MSENTPIPLPDRLDMRQLRTQAKELLKELPPGGKLADAQLRLARRHGFPSWPRLVDAAETPVLLARLRRLVELGDAEALDRLLARRTSLRKRLNEPLFGFDAPPVVRAAGHRAAARLLPVLVRHGADPNVRSTWWAGGFGALDAAKGDAVDVLLALGARWDVWSASAHGRVDVLRSLLDADPASVNAPGGDGETPLHFAQDAPTAQLLIERGADLERKDVDHESTPLQYHVQNHDVLRLLLRRGARPDVFAAAALDDVELLRRVLADDPGAAHARVGRPPFVTTASEGGHIYVYRLGGGKTPQQVAAQSGALGVLRALAGQSPGRDLVAAAWMEDAAAVARLKGSPIEPEEDGALAQAAQEGRAETVRLLLDAGFDPTAPGMDSGSALHVACWFGHLPVVRLLLGRVPLDRLDAHHGSPPLGWAAHGAQWCHNPQGDYPGVVRALIEAGADPRAVANEGGASMLEQAGDREDVKAILRSYLSGPGERPTRAGNV